MPPIEIGPTRPVGPVQVSVAAAGSAQQSGQNKVQTAPTPQVVERSDALDAGAAPVDAERVQVIRKAVQQGTYPVIPTKIADAMIAAGMLLRSTPA